MQRIVLVPLDCLAHFIGGRTLFVNISEVLPKRIGEIFVSGLRRNAAELDGIIVKMSQFINQHVANVIGVIRTECIFKEDNRTRGVPELAKPLSTLRFAPFSPNRLVK